MLQAVGHPVAVHPDRELLRVARAEGWEVRRFSRRVRLGDRVSMPTPKRAAAGAAALTVVVGVALAARWWWGRHKPSSPGPMSLG